MPFVSDKQRKYLWANKPEVAKKFAQYHAEGGYTEDGIATHYRNGKKKPQSQIDYERRVRQSNQRLSEQVAPLAQIGAGFIPGVGESMDALDAYTAFKEGDTKGGLSIAATGLLGLIPGVGDAAATAARVARRAQKMGVDPDAVKKSWEAAHQNVKKLKAAAARDPKGKAAKKVKDLERQLGPDWDNRLADMEIESKHPELADVQYGPITPIKHAESGTLRQQHPRAYRNYQTEEGRNIHALYGDQAGENPWTPVNILGGTTEELPVGSPVQRGNRGVQLEAETVGGASRPTAESYELIGQASNPNWRGNPITTAADVITPEMTRQVNTVMDPMIKQLKAKGYTDTQIANIMKNR